MSEYKHGSMDVEQNEKDFSTFVKFSRNVIVIAILVLIFLAIFNS
ncbi:MAG: aa3-type cytochrome c oxidase subunit IV [Rhodobacteraceae bacterium]|nr:aa3-type cytochrome c oxidase subunit IV [Paracoccaceae bacterium]MDE2759685.1 aa3-type cytochrome c oxidase subunit IV [Paracoccaceae bacterium]MDE2916059.1 aa3-type cytochrome c oxidase subunit IV [Paracoccaceae bacterium]MYG42547.1 aa3-type cytochrome c oxidase subunit IV [Paracoccaceae bacterium]